MIPYEELDRALARWKARAQGVVGGAVEAPAVEAHSEGLAHAEVLSYDDDGQATPMPISSEELGSIPNAAAAPTEGTGEIDVNELEAYEEEEA